MKIEFKIDFGEGIEKLYNSIKEWNAKRVCKREGHVWEPYENFWGDAFWPFYFRREVEKTCKRCGEVVYKSPPKQGEKLKIKRYSELTEKKLKKSVKKLRKA